MTFHNIPTKERKSSHWPPLHYYAQSSLAEHIPQQLGQRAEFPGLSWKKRSSLPSYIAKHCKGQMTTVTSGAMVVLQLVKTKHLPTKIQVQRCSKCDLLAPNQLFTAHHLWSHKLVLIVPVYSTRIVELWSCSSLFCSLFSYGKGFPRTISLFPLNKREKVGWNYIYIASQLWCSRLTTANFIFKNLWVELHSTKEGSLF